MGSVLFKMIWGRGLVLFFGFLFLLQQLLVYSQSWIKKPSQNGGKTFKNINLLVNDQRVLCAQNSVVKCGYNMTTLYLRATDVDLNLALARCSVFLLSFAKGSSIRFIQTTELKLFWW